MSILDKFKKWLDENEGEFRDSSEKATKFLEDLGREIGYAGSKVAKSAEEALNKFDEELSKEKGQKNKAGEENPYESEPKSNPKKEEYFEDEEDNTASEEEDIEQTEKEVTHVEQLMERIDELIAELKEEDEDEVPDPRDHKSAIDQDWGGLDDDFIKKATKFADRELSKGDSDKSKKKSEGNVKGFEDRDNDGDDIVDDAEIEEDE